jgi:hypothetical protein
MNVTDQYSAYPIWEPRENLRIRFRISFPRVAHKNEVLTRETFYESGDFFNLKLRCPAQVRKQLSANNVTVSDRNDTHVPAKRLKACLFRKLLERLEKLPRARGHDMELNALP